jgi:hypothetical protein
MKSRAGSNGSDPRRELLTDNATRPGGEWIHFNRAVVAPANRAQTNRRKALSLYLVVRDA